MTDGVEITYSDNQVRAHLARMPEDVRSAVRATIMRLTPKLAARVRQKLTSGPLHVRSGKLLGSIKSEMVENVHEVYGRVYSSGVVYAAIHEFGGRTKPHVIVPVRAKALRFFWPKVGAVVFRKRVNHPGSLIPKRSYLRASLDEMHGQIVSEMRSDLRARIER